MSNPEAGNEDRIIIAMTTGEFHTNCQLLLDRGYEVIPGTIKVAMTPASDGVRHALFHCVCVAFFRKRVV